MNKKLKLEIGCYLDMSIRDNRNVLGFLHDLLNESLTIQLAIKCNKTKALLLEIGKFISSTNKELNEIYRNSNVDSDLDGELESIADELVTEACDILNTYTPDYTYLGFNDGSFGLWCSIENVKYDFDGIILQGLDTHYLIPKDFMHLVPEKFTGHILLTDNSNNPLELLLKTENVEKIEVIWRI